MRVRNHWSLLTLVLAAASIVAVACLVGCGGSSSTSPGSGLNPSGDQPPAGYGAVTFTVNWPRTGEANTAAIPTAANALAVFAGGPGIKNAICTLVPRTTSKYGTPVTIYVPAGEKRLISAEARTMANPPTAPLTAPTWTQLLDGQSPIAAGVDGTPMDIGSGETKATSIVLAPPVPLASTVTDIYPVLNQVITDDFPVVKVLQMVRDQTGRVIANLNAGNVEVEENGERCPVIDCRNIGAAGASLNVCLVLDRSGSMSGTPTTDLNQAATNFVNSLSGTDQAAIVNFGSSVEVVQGFTSNKATLLSAISQDQSMGSTAIYDAVMTGVEETAAIGGRGACILMTDGYENASTRTDLGTLLAWLRLQGVPVFTISIGRTDAGDLEQIANASGGLHISGQDSTELAQMYATISQQLGMQMQLLYKSASAKNTVHVQPGAATYSLTVRWKLDSLQGSSQTQFTL